MAELNTAPPTAPATPRKPSKLMADLSAAIRSTAEAARDQALAQIDADAKQVVESIREQSTEGAAVLRKQSDEDIAGIRDWSKAEIARIREETEQRITARKTELDEELADHAASVDRRVEAVQAEVTRYQADMESYLERLRGEDDPASLATMAESMPETPTFESWTGHRVDVERATAPEAVADVASPATDETEPDAQPAATDAEAPAVSAADQGQEAEASAHVDTEVSSLEPEPRDEAADDAPAITEGGGFESTAPDGDGSSAAPSWGAGSSNTTPTSPGSAWGDEEGGWTAKPVASAQAAGGADASGEAPRWTDEDAPVALSAGSEPGESVDRGTIMAALEADAEAVVTADPADQAEPTGGVAEPATEPGESTYGDLEDDAAQAAIAARLETGVFETESFADRLASLLPGHGGGAPDGEPAVTQVVVAGLVSVASIASFKRHLGRLVGVQGVAVASGPEGEFVFTVNHSPDVVFRDVIPTMPGFAARVTSVGDGVVHVTARDPEAES